MKLSIWQQFSSNHSSQFMVIGRFESASVATTKADMLRDWMYRMLISNDRKAAEVEIRAMYQMDWYEEGIWWNGAVNDIDQVVRQVEGDVFLMTPVQTKDSPEPFVTLMNKMGAKVVRKYHRQKMIVEMAATAPDQKTAQAVYDELHGMMQIFQMIGQPVVRHIWKTFEEEASYIHTLALDKTIISAKIECRDGVSFAVLYDYLKAQNFTDIRYTFIQG